MRTRNVKLNWVGIAAAGAGIGLLICGFLVPAGAGLMDIAAGIVAIIFALLYRPPRRAWHWWSLFRR